MAKKVSEYVKKKGIGTVYQGALTTVQVLAPVTNEALVPGTTVDRFTTQTLARVTGYDRAAGTENLGLAKPYLKGLASTALQRWADKKVGHTAALSRHSLTAWFAEAIAQATAIEDGLNSPHELKTYNARLNEITNGHNPAKHTFDTKQGLRPYVGIKYIGGGVRMLINRVPFLNSAAKPLKSFLGDVGLSL